MEKIAEPMPGLIVAAPKLFRDERGWFMESYNQKFWQSLGHTHTYVQDNRSLSAAGTLRGLHFQTGEFAQAKLVYCLRGEVLDVAVDMRADSPTCGQHFSIVLSDQNHLQLFIPRGFAHGFVVLSEEAEFFYKCDNFYHPASESGIIFDDAQLAIDWKLPHDKLLIAPKDRQWKTLREVLG